MEHRQGLEQACFRAGDRAQLHAGQGAGDHTWQGAGSDTRSCKLLDVCGTVQVTTCCCYVNLFSHGIGFFLQSEKNGMDLAH